jgi:toxin-antitoxin system PIN domain toxin
VKGYLLDTNVLIALLWPSHAHHTRAVRWFTRHRSNGWATCPFTQAGFVRIVSNPAFSRDAVTPRDAVGVLATNTASKDHLFWPDELPLVEAVAFAGSKLLGHQQVTDAYLLGLVLRRGGKLATLDERITALAEPDSVQRRAVEAIA